MERKERADSDRRKDLEYNQRRWEEFRVKRLIVVQKYCDKKKLVKRLGLLVKHILTFHYLRADMRIIKR
jgi:hypothetical protein